MLRIGPGNAARSRLSCATCATASPLTRGRPFKDATPFKSIRVPSRGEFAWSRTRAAGFDPEHRAPCAPQFGPRRQQFRCRLPSVGGATINTGNRPPASRRRCQRGGLRVGYELIPVSSCPSACAVSSARRAGDESRRSTRHARQQPCAIAARLIVSPSVSGRAMSGEPSAASA